MQPQWLITVRSLLRDLKRADSAKPQKAQLEHLRATIHSAEEISGLQNRYCMVVLSGSKKSAQYCAEYVSAWLPKWIKGNLTEQTAVGVRIEIKPKLRIKTVPYSLQAEQIALFQRDATTECPDISIVIRPEQRCGALITSAELYALLSMAANRAEREPLQNFVQVRLLVIYSHWVQVVTAKMTRSYITSILEGSSVIADQMDIYQTPWFNFTDVPGQQRVLLCALEAVELEPSTSKELRSPLEDIPKNVQQSKPPKRKLYASGGENKRTKH